MSLANYFGLLVFLLKLVTFLLLTSLGAAKEPLIVTPLMEFVRQKRASKNASHVNV